MRRTGRPDIADKAVIDFDVPDVFPVNNGFFSDLNAVDQIVHRFTVKLPYVQVLSDDCRPALNVGGALLILPDFRKKRIQPVGPLAA